jgi:uncharacterized membrane protein
MADETARPPSRQETASIGDVIDTVKAYAKQETVDPLKRAGKYVGFAAAGGLLTGLGLSLVLLGLLRFVQSEWDRLATGRLSWLAYVVTLVGVVVLGGLSMWYANRQIKKSITGEDRT